MLQIVELHKDIRISKAKAKSCKESTWCKRQTGHAFYKINPQKRKGLLSTLLSLEAMATETTKHQPKPPTIIATEESTTKTLLDWKFPRHFQNQSAKKGQKSLQLEALVQRKLHFALLLHLPINRST